MIRITLDSWQDLGQPTATIPGAQPGSQLAGTLTVTATASACIIDGRLRTLAAKTFQVDTFPWHVDVVDPTEATRSIPDTPWGYTLRLAAPGARPIEAALTPDTIAAITPAGGIRVARLEEHVRLATTEENHR